jgi:peptidyl-prolyl cis-trans isomerase D
MRGVVAWVIGILIILAMAVVGVPALENFGSRSAIKVGQTEITARELELELRGQIQTQQIENPGVTREQLIAAGIAQQTIDQLITRALIQNEAKRLGLVTPDSVVRDYIENIEGLSDPETGRFDQQRLGLFLQQRGLSLTGFRDLVAGDLMRSQVIEALTAGTAAPQDLARLIVIREFEERTIDLVEVPVTEEALTPSDEEAEAFYSANIEAFQSPEYRTFTVLTVSEEDVADSIEVDEAEVRQLYDARVGSAAAAERRSVRQLRLTGDASARAEDLVAEGADFEAIAEETGGSVTTLADQTRAEFINPELAEAVFEAEEGALVGPVETPFGSVLAQVTGITASEVASFEEQREQLEADLRAEIAEDRFAEIVETVEVARDEGASLSEAAQSAGLTARTVGPLDAELFTKSGSIANLSRRLGAEGFRLEEGDESSAIPLEAGYGFISVESVEEPRPLPLADVRERVDAGVRAERQEGFAAETEARFRAALAEGKDFAAAAEAVGGNLVQVTLTPREDMEGVPSEARVAAFDQNVGAIETLPVPGSDAVYILRVNEVAYGDTSAAAAVLPALTAQYGQQLSSELAETYLTALRASTDIRQSPNQIARAIGTEDR